MLLLRSAGTAAGGVSTSGAAVSRPHPHTKWRVPLGPVAEESAMRLQHANTAAVEAADASERLGGWEQWGDTQRRAIRYRHKISSTLLACCRRRIASAARPIRAMTARSKQALLIASIPSKRGMHRRRWDAQWSRGRRSGRKEWRPVEHRALGEADAEGAQTAALAQAAHLTVQAAALCMQRRHSRHVFYAAVAPY